MTTDLHWPEIALRLFLTVLAGALIGMNRGEHGHPAGLRTTLLVCLAASLSMIQVNLLLGMAGKASNSFVVLDLMRLPLGILSGMGFIGAGAIIRKDDLVLGVTTAATLWFVTVLGLCFGGGQLLLGLIALALGLVVLSVFKRIERLAKQDRKAVIKVSVQADGPADDDFVRRLEGAGLRIASWRVGFSNENLGRRREITWMVHWRGRPTESRPPGIVEEFAREPGVLSVDWDA
jgi:putative Mg2+ transporter-C (MgtC) family protein